MITIRKGLSAAQEIRAHYVTAASNPVAWNQSIALEAALSALESQERQIARLEGVMQQIAAQFHRR